MYVSENVQQITGFNQVDLAHRCLYGTLHPDDTCAVRDVLENGGNFAFIPQTETRASRKRNHDSHEKVRKEGEIPLAVSFFCRMKCFSANSTGFLKMHCTGQIKASSKSPQSRRHSDRVALLYCRPFLSTGCDVDNDVKQGVFWSKHDLDLKFKDIEAKCVECLGLVRENVIDRSLYQLVHPEDLHIVTHVHKLILEINEVQSFYLRLQDKSGAWKWFLSKGKVIARNSKKFSIVFTHCPVRDDENTFLHREATLRQKHGIVRLLNITATSKQSTVAQQTMTTNSPDGCLPYFHVTKNRAQPGPSTPQLPLETRHSHSDELSHILSSMIPGPCPSSWHANTDRHSPVLPSSHVAHKLSIRERHLQLAGQKRYQEINNYQPCNSLRNGFLGDQDTMKRDNFSVVEDVNRTVHCHSSGTLPIRQYNSMLQDQQILDQDQSNFMYGMPYGQSSNYQEPGRFHYVNVWLSEPYPYPPSPPPSPQTQLPSLQARNPPVVHIGNTSYNSMFKPIYRPIQHDLNQRCPSHRSNVSGLPINSDLQFDHGFRGCIHARADVKISMTYSPCANQEHGASLGENDISMRNENFTDQSWFDIRTKVEDNKSAIKASCTLSKKAKKNRTPKSVYECESSMHMEIVESDAECVRPNIELALTGSFMDYLNS